MEEEQCGFRPNRSTTTDLIFSIRQITEKVIEYNEEVHVCFIYLEKAFDSIPRKRNMGGFKKKKSE